jgi:hypothetical protein
MPTDNMITNGRAESLKWAAAFVVAGSMWTVGLINPSKWSLETNVENKINTTLGEGCSLDTLIQQSVPYKHWVFNVWPVPAWAEMHVDLRRSGSREVMAVPVDDTDKIYQTTVPKSRLPRQASNPTCGVGSG